jgi:multidrug transporter EmrE-like cation transporter
MKNFLAVIITVFLVSMSQFLFKKSVAEIPNIEFNQKMIPQLVHAIFNVYILLGIIMYLLSLFVWLVVLSDTELSIAYPLLSLAYIATFILGVIFLGESITINKIVGIIIICSGVFVLTQNFL